MRVAITAIPVSLIDNFDITRNFALDTIVGFTFHLALFVEFCTAALDILDCTPNELNSLVFLELMINESMLLT